jgi:hypothetical protein
MNASRHLIRATLAVLAVVAVAGPAAASAAATASPATSPTAPPSATLTACVDGATLAERSASFSAEMQAVAGTRTMSVSFQLYERTAGHGYVSVSAPGFGVWQVSNPGINVFTANENVIDLPAPGAFRAKVRYRWIGPRGHVIRRDVLVTPACLLTLLEPDVSILRITRAPGATAGSETYGVVVRNEGSLAAEPFSVAFSIGTSALTPQTVSGLAVSATQVVQFSGPRCLSGTALTAQVDLSGSPLEPTNPNRKLTIVCGAGG